MANIIVMSDTHGSENYVDQAREAASVVDAKAVFLLGDVGPILDYFLDTFKDMDVFIIPGNHDSRRKLKRAIANYPNAKIVDGEIIHYDNVYIVAKGFGHSMVAGWKYAHKLASLLEEATSGGHYLNRVILMTHCGGGHLHKLAHFLEFGHRWATELYNGKILQIHGHEHRWGFMYSSLSYRLFKKLKETTSYKGNLVWNAAQKVLVINTGLIFDKANVRERSEE